MNARTDARTHAHTHAHTHTRTHAHTLQVAAGKAVLDEVLKPLVRRLLQEGRALGITHTDALPELENGAPTTSSKSTCRTPGAYQLETEGGQSLRGEVGDNEGTRGASAEVSADPSASEVGVECLRMFTYVRT